MAWLEKTQSSTATLGDTVISQGISDMLQELTNVAFLDQPPIAGEGFEFTDMFNLLTTRDQARGFMLLHCRV